MNILAISGSLKPTSSNSRLLRAAADMAAGDIDFTLFDQQIGDLPHFRPDLDEEGATPAPTVAEFRRLVTSADGVLVSCPEYAHGVPGAFKNALDWLVSSSELTGKPLCLLMAGPGGARQAWTALAPTLRVMGANLVFEACLVVGATSFDAQGRLLDTGVAAKVRDGLDALCAAIRAGNA